jgi:hypothetical protein
METPPAERELVLGQLARVLSSEGFRRSERSSALLRYLVEQTLDGRAERLKEYTLGAEALGRGDNFDPRADPIVRAEASRLRTRLERYYETEGANDPLVLLLPRGTYVPTFAPRPSPNGAAEERSTAPAESPSPQHPRSIPPLRVAAFILLALGAAAAAFWWGRSTGRDTAARPFLLLDVDLRSEGVLGSEVGADLALSPDGTLLVFVTRDPDGVAHLNSRRLDRPEAVRLPDTEGARSPFISPDGRWAGFWAGGKMKKTPVDGGSPVVLCDATDLLGASWSEGGDIIAAINPTSKLWRIPAAGGAPEAILDLSAESAFPAWPQVLPGGRYVIYTVLTGLGSDRSNVEVRAIRGGERKVLVRGGTFGRYVEGGHLTYVNQGTLYAAPFDPDSLTVGGPPAPVLENISYSRTFGYAQVDASRTGTVVYRAGAEGERFTVGWLDRSGKTAPLLAKPGRYEWLRLSPDGSRLAYSAVESGATSVWVYDGAGREAKRLTTPEDPYTSMLWAPDGRTLVLGGKSGMAWVDADSPSRPRPLTTDNTIQVPWSFTPDGGRLAYYEMSPATGFDLWSVPVRAGGGGLEVGTPEPLLRTPAFECYPSFSPDGRWLAYASNETGTWEVYVRTLPDDGRKVRVSGAGGTLPRWLPNGRELAYRTLDHRIMVTEYGSQHGAFVAGEPRAWSQQRLGDTGVLPNFDVGPGDGRMAALMPVAPPDGQQNHNHITFLLNFSDELRRRTSSAEDAR